MTVTIKSEQQQQQKQYLLLSQDHINNHTSPMSHTMNEDILDNHEFPLSTNFDFDMLSHQTSLLDHPHLNLLSTISSSSHPTHIHTTSNSHPSSTNNSSSNHNNIKSTTKTANNDIKLLPIIPLTPSSFPSSTSTIINNNNINNNTLHPLNFSRLSVSESFVDDHPLVGIPNDNDHVLSSYQTTHEFHHQFHHPNHHDTFAISPQELTATTSAPAIASNHFNTTAAVPMINNGDKHDIQEAVIKLEKNNHVETLQQQNIEQENNNLMMNMILNHHHQQDDNNNNNDLLNVMSPSLPINMNTMNTNNNKNPNRTLTTTVPGSLVGGLATSVATTCSGSYPDQSSLSQLPFNLPTSSSLSTHANTNTNNNNYYNYDNTDNNNNMNNTNITAVGNNNVSGVGDKRRKRRESHNAVERRRRDTINEKIHELSILLPDLVIEMNNGGPRPNKGMILKRSVDYIRHVQSLMMTQIERTRELEDTIRRLLLLSGKTEEELGLSQPLETVVISDALIPPPLLVSPTCVSNVKCFAGTSLKNEFEDGNHLYPASITHIPHQHLHHHAHNSNTICSSLPMSMTGGGSVGDPMNFVNGLDCNNGLGNRCMSLNDSVVFGSLPGNAPSAAVAVAAAGLVGDVHHYGNNNNINSSSSNSSNTNCTGYVGQSSVIQHTSVGQFLQQQLLSSSKLNANDNNVNTNHGGHHNHHSNSGSGSINNCSGSGSINNCSNSNNNNNNNNDNNNGTISNSSNNNNNLMTDNSSGNNNNSGNGMLINQQDQGFFEYVIQDEIMKD